MRRIVNILAKMVSAIVLALIFLLAAAPISQGLFGHQHYQNLVRLVALVQMGIAWANFLLALMKGFRDAAGNALSLIIGSVVGVAAWFVCYKLGDYQGALLGMALVPALSDWWAFCPRILAPVLRIGVPGATTELGYRAAFMVSLAATARLGVVALATHSYVLQLLRYVFLISLSIGWACEIMVGHLVGAGEFRTAHQLVRKGLRNGVLASGTLAVLAAACAPWLMRAFTRDPAVIASAQTLLWIACALETGRVANMVVLGALRATGDAIYPTLASMASLVLVLGLGSVVLGRMFGLPGIFAAYAADECIRSLIMLHRWETHGWVRHAREILVRMRTPGAETRF